MRFYVTIGKIFKIDRFNLVKYISAFWILKIRMEMHSDKKSVLLIAMPFARTGIPSIQLPILEGYLRERGININSRHLYLIAADFYGLNNYNYLVCPPNDSYSAQMGFSRYVFPEHWNKNLDKFREYFDKNTVKNPIVKESFTFDSYVQQTEKFYNWAIEQFNWKDYDIIGFTLNYGQFLPSLAVAKRIKELDPGKKIIFGGSRTVGNLGVKVLETFDYIDFVVSGDGEEALYRLVSDYQNFESIPRLMYRVGKEIIWNKSEDVVDINSLLLPSYDPFYEELNLVSSDIKQYFYLQGRLPVEISRGCWWNRCTFCNLSVQHETYREKNVDRIVEEVQFLSDRYKMLDFQMIGNTLPKKCYRELFEKIKNLGKDFSIFVEARAGRLKSDDYHLLREAGFTSIQTGVETFSPCYIRKMNKGVRVIDNIAALKFCKENGIKNEYNLIVGYPNEENVDFEGTQRNIQFFKQFLDPPNISQLIVEYGSAIYNHPGEFNIESLEPTKIDGVMFPMDVLDRGLSFFYGFKRIRDLGENNWEQLVDEWKKEHEQNLQLGLKTQKTIDKLMFYYLDGRGFLKIYDKRYGENIRIYVLDEVEREVFLSCTDVVSYKELGERFSSIPDYQLAAILHSFEQNGILFKEDDHYLSLPLRYSQTISIFPEKKVMTASC